MKHDVRQHGHSVFCRHHISPICCLRKLPIWRGDSQAAGRYFTSLTRDRDTAFLGHIGLARLALEDDRTDDALASARQALGLRPKSAMAARQVLALEAERGNWAAAMPALQIVASDRDRSDIDDAIIARQRAALFYLDTLDQAEANTNVKDTAKDQITRLNAAITAWPEFWPAALRLADLYEEAGTPKKAIKPLEKSFRAMPHTDVAARLAELWQVNEGSQIPGFCAGFQQMRRMWRWLMKAAVWLPSTL